MKLLNEIINPPIYLCYNGYFTPMADPIEIKSIFGQFGEMYWVHMEISHFRFTNVGILKL